MTKRSMVLALACWSLTSTLAMAQFGLPGAGCEPVPLNTWNAPPGPGDDLALPADIPNAFSPPKECCLECFVSLGSLALKRQRMGQAAIATNGAGETAMEFDDVRTNFNLGARAAGGFIYGNQAIEFTGYYIPAHDSSITSTDAGLTTFFTNNLGPLNAPLLLRTTLTSTIGNYEVNYRTWPGGTSGLEWIIGCRYLDLLESLAILGSDGANVETYTARTYNRIVGPTLGVEYGIPVGSSAAFTLAAKGTWGWNLVNSTVFLQNNGVLNFEDETNRDFFSHVYEIAFYADVWIADPVHVRLGCQALWALHVAEAVKQINADAQAPSIPNNQGSIMYWGPVAEIQFVW